MRKAIWKYYYDVTRYNIAFSIVLGFITLDPLKGAVSLATGGMIFSLYCYKQFQNNQYYFYYNLGLSKTRLISTTWGINFMLAFFISVILLTMK